ncbi:MAG: GNAT family N-acetyltransferase [Pseudonocardiaceae bacterium]
MTAAPIEYPTGTWRRIDRSLLTPHQLDPDSLDEAVDLLEEAASWLKSKGIEQWPSSFRAPGKDDILKDRVEGLRRHADAGQLWVLRDGGNNDQAVATAVVTHWPELDFAHGWPGGHSDLFDARYLCRMAVARAVSQQGLGRVMIGYAEWLARAAGITYLRLDCSKSNEKLHAYYRRAGFDQVGLVDLNDRKTGALFQKRV